MRSAARYVALALGSLLVAIGVFLAAMVIAVAAGERGWLAVGPELLTSAPLILFALASGCLLLILTARLRPSPRRRSG